MDNYIEFVEQQLEIFKKHTTLLNANNEITPVLINKNLGEFTNVGIALNMEYQRVKNTLVNLKRDFNEWWDTKYVEMRHKLNPLDLPGNKWSSQREIDAETKVANAKEFREWDIKVQEQEMRVSFLNSLREQWQDHSKIIITLSQNARTEMMYLPTEIMRKEKQINTN